MNTIEITTQPRLIAASRLEKSPLNARRTIAKMGMEELKASLLAHGLMQNLVVTDAGDGRFLVIAGSRRLEAIHALQSEGRLPSDFAVPCQVVSDEHALEMSLAENNIRQAMHPADQFDAFAALIDQGATAAEVAQRFGIDESLVVKRMKLARVAPQLIKEYREDGITLECLMAFTITDDHRRQLKVFKSLQDWQKRNPSAIREALTEKFVEADSKLAKFVGVDAYVAAGGTTRADLFGDEVYLEKPALLQKLVKQKLDGIRKELEAESWGWIEINSERDWQVINRFSRIQPHLMDAPADLLIRREQIKAEIDTLRMALDEADDKETAAFETSYDEADKQLEHIEEQLSAYIGFEAEQKAIAGCYVSIGHDGSPFVDKGLVKPEHRRQLAKLIGTPAGDNESAAPKPKGPLSESLRRQLAVFRLHAAQVELSKHPQIAIDLLTFQVASRLLASQMVNDGPKVQFQLGHPTQPDQEPTTAVQAFAEIEQSLAAKWRKPASEADRFEAFRSLPEAEKQKLLAYCIALTLQPKLGPAEGEEGTAYDIALALTGGNVAGYWRPADSFLARISRDQLLALGRETLGDAWASSRASDKKSQLVEQLDRAFADPAKYGRTPEQVEKLKSWLPAGMAFGPFTTPKPAKARKARKAA